MIEHKDVQSSCGAMNKDIGMPESKPSTFRLYKYLSIARPEDWGHRRQLLVDRTLYFSDPGQFNDPLDCALADNNPAKNLLHDSISVFCLSRENRDDVLMFAHYGDHHRGFRLTFEVSNDKPIGECHTLELGEKVEYCDERPQFTDKNIHRMLLMKALSWHYEDEYRIFMVTDKQQTYPADCLIEVAFGYRMNRDFEPVIRKWVGEGQHQRVSFRRAVPSESRIGFDYEDA
jgi:hypothetical protein